MKVRTLFTRVLRKSRLPASLRHALYGVVMGLGLASRAYAHEDGSQHPHLAVDLGGGTGQVILTVFALFVGSGVYWIVQKLALTRSGQLISGQGE